jgi:hypothetical protein
MEGMNPFVYFMQLSIGQQLWLLLLTLALWCGVLLLLSVAVESAMQKIMQLTWRPLRNIEDTHSSVERSGTDKRK